MSNEEMLNIIMNAIQMNKDEAVSQICGQICGQLAALQQENAELRSSINELRMVVEQLQYR
jgi:hypothetical protein